MPANAETDADSAKNYCQTIVAYRIGATSVMSIQITEVKPLLNGEKWLVTGEVKNQKPTVTYACLIKNENKKSVLEKLELFQLEDEKK